MNDISQDIISISDSKLVELWQMIDLFDEPSDDWLEVYNEMCFRGLIGYLDFIIEVGQNGEKRYTRRNRES